MHHIVLAPTQWGVALAILKIILDTRLMRRSVPHRPRTHAVGRGKGPTAQRWDRRGVAATGSAFRLSLNSTASTPLLPHHASHGGSPSSPHCVGARTFGVVLKIILDTFLVIGL
jgi:hypothetical protein